MDQPTTDLRCSQCGAQLSPGAAYCSACGRKVLDQTSQKGSVLLDRSRREKAAIAIFSLVVVFCWYELAENVAYRIPAQPYQISSFLLFSGILAASLARKRKVLWFFAGCLASLPLMFVAGLVGGFFR